MQTTTVLNTRAANAFERITKLMNSGFIDTSDTALLVELQDLIGRRSLGELAEFEAGLDRMARRRWLWLLFTVMGPDNAVSIFAETTGRRVIDERAEEAEAELAAQWNDLRAREQALEDGKRTIWKRIRDLRQKLQHSERWAKHFLEQAREWQCRALAAEAREAELLEEVRDLRALRDAIKRVLV